MSTKKRFFKIGPEASAFYDPALKLKVTNNFPGKLELPREKKINPKGATSVALKNGHIVEIDESEYEELMSAHSSNVRKADEASAKSKKKPALKKVAPKKEKEDDDEVDLRAMKVDELDKYAAEMLDKEDLDNYKKLSNKEAKVKFLEESLES